MEDRRLMTWGGVSALVFVVLLTISVATAWLTGAGIAFRAWVPLWSALVCFLVVATVAGHEYLLARSNVLARVGVAFAALAVVMFFLEGAVWRADQIVRGQSDGAVSEPGPLLALFGSLHAMVLWFVALWLGCWGAALVQDQGKAKVAGVLMLLVAASNLGAYTLLRFGATGILVDLYHLAGQVVLIGAFAMLGLVLLEAPRAPDSAGGTVGRGP